MDKTTTASTRLSFSPLNQRHQIACPLDEELLADFRARSFASPPFSVTKVLDTWLEPRRYFRFLQLLSQGNECWIFDGPRTHNGYGSFSVGGRKGKDLRAHRLAYTLWKGPIENGFQCLHVKECQFRSCCRPFHLYSGTPKDNTDDMMEKGTHKYKLVNVVTDEIVSAMRYYRGLGFSLLETGKRVGVSGETVRIYLNGTATVGQPRIIGNG